MYISYTTECNNPMHISGCCYVWLSAVNGIAPFPQSRHGMPKQCVAYEMCAIHLLLQSRGVHNEYNEDYWG